MTMWDTPIGPGMAREHQRYLLKWASALTTSPEEPAAVIANAQPLHRWLASASGPDDKRNRFAALEQAHDNRARDRDPDDRPDLLIAEAETYYAFLRAA